MAALPQAPFKLSQIFLVEAGFQHRADFLQMPPTERADVGEVKVGVEVAIEEGGRVGVVTLGVSTDPNRSPSPLYQFAVRLGAIIEATTAAKVEMGPELAASAVTMLYPFIREAVASLTTRGRFGAIWIQPIDVAGVFKEFAVRQQGTVKPTRPPKQRVKKK